MQSPPRHEKATKPPTTCQKLAEIAQIHQNRRNDKIFYNSFACDKLFITGIFLSIVKLKMSMYNVATKQSKAHKNKPCYLRRNTLCIIRQELMKVLRIRKNRKA